MGRTVYKLLKPGVTMAQVDECLKQQTWVGPAGPTTMFLISTHLFKPELGLLNEYEVGIGEHEAFTLLFPET